MIIDAHAHMEVFPTKGFYDTPEKVIKYMDMANIDMAVVSTYSNWPEKSDSLEDLIENCSLYPGRFIPYVRLNPRYSDKMDWAIDHAIKMGYKGIKLHPAAYTVKPIAKPTINILRKAGEYGIPVLFHCSDEDMTLPLQIKEAASLCPETNIILAHMGGFMHRDDAIAVASEYDNVFLDMCEMPFAKSIKDAVRRAGAEKILFGTDLPTDNPVFEIEKVKLAGLKKEEEECIFYKNIARLLNIDVEGK